MSIQIRPQAEDELIALLAGIRAKSATAAIKVERKVYDTLTLLEANPLSGPVMKTTNPRLSGLRFATVQRYPQFLILYLPSAAGIDVLHIVRGLRNIQSLLAAD